MLAAADGNISFRESNSKIWMTPSGVAKSEMHEDDIACLTLENEILRGRPSGERLMHLAIYKAVPEAKAVVHAHPPTAIAWSLAHPEMKELPSDVLPEVILAVGGMPIAPYARPGTQDMGDVLLPYLPQHRVLILARHGGIAWGESLEEAYAGIERLEHSAHILWLAHTLGKPQALPASEVKALRVLREQLGPKIL
ncbi:MAG: class II aldolase/adducin family protein [Bdellovibrionales bacterium]|nr:class II aldolase/adducin family protein [Bdellovibrionales bacterium]